MAPKTSDFITEVAQSDMFEIESSKLAAAKGQGDVRSFANQMVTDHTKTTSELKPLAQAAHVTPPTQMSGEQRSKLDKLKAVSAKDFAALYIESQVTAHKAAVSLFQRYTQGGDNGPLKAWAGKTLPALQHHQDMAQGLQRVTTGSR